MSPPRSKKPRNPSGTPTPIRLDDETIARIKGASKKLNLSFADTFRLAAGVGMLRLAAIDYDLANAVLWKSEEAEVARFTSSDATLCRRDEALPQQS